MPKNSKESDTAAQDRTLLEDQAAGRRSVVDNINLYGAEYNVYGIETLQLVAKQLYLVEGPDSDLLAALAFETILALNYYRARVLEPSLDGLPIREARVFARSWVNDFLFPDETVAADFLKAIDRRLKK